MRVLHVIPSLSPLNGGPSFALHALTRSLAAAGARVDVASTDDHGAFHIAAPLERFISWDPLRFIFFPRRRRFYTMAPSFASWFEKSVRDYDVIHVHALFSHLSTMAARIASGSGVPYIVQPHGSLGHWGFRHRRPWLKKMSLRWVESSIVKNAAYLYMQSEQEALEARSFGIPFSARVIPYIMDLPSPRPPAERQIQARQFLERYPAAADCKRLVFLSRLDGKKGLDVLLPAFQTIRRAHPDTVLIVAGGGAPEFESQLRRDIESLGLTGRVILPGFLSGAEKWSLLAAADLFLLPSHSESFGIAAAEAMAAGAPVLVSDQVPLSSYLRSYSAGLVTACDSGAVAAAASDFLAAPASAAIVENGHRVIMENFTPEVIAKRTLALYEEAAATKGRRP